MYEDIKAIPENAVILFHTCAHNPTGVDPSMEQWQQLADIVSAQNLLPLFDTAYQGFVTGKPDQDAASVRYFVSRGIELLATQSCAKNFGLYNERAGCLTLVLANAAATERAVSQLKVLVRPMISNPPCHGAAVVATILGSPGLKAQWLEELGQMAGRISDMRQRLHALLQDKGTPGTWDHIVKQRGMFTYTGLNAQQVRQLTDKYHIYLLNSGRINMCGLNTSNIEYVAEAIHVVVTASSNS